MLAWYDTFIDWEQAPEPSRWWPREEAAFNAAAQELLVLLRKHLGAEFEVVDESGTAGPAEPSAAADPTRGAIPHS